jgi:membrane-bound lytic murein transglycosylase A
MQAGREFAQARGGSVFASLLGTIICFVATGALAEGPLKFAGSQLEPIKWSELAGWTADDHLAAFAAYQTSCQALVKVRRGEERGELFSALSNVCRKAATLRPQDMETARAFFEQNFQPVRIARLGEAQGLLTGYFEPIVMGSRFPSPEFHVPLYRRPRDLVAAGYKPGSVAFPNKGGRIGRRNGNNDLVPYYDRGAIEAGALDAQKLEICWLRDPFDLLALQLEGSGRVILEDGTPLRVSFDSHNGYAYSSIERVLITRNLIPRNAMSRQSIHDWMAAHPDEAAKARAANRSYVFFRITGLTNDGEPIGAQGVPLTPGRSIAVDRGHEYGTPFFIEADLPIAGRKPALSFHRLMIAQDTGSAIVGPARADLYWGAGDEAGRIAGRIRHPGRFVMLLPREVDIAVAGREPPLPVPKPKIAALDVGKQGKDKMESVGTGAARGEMPPPRKPSIVAFEAKKRDEKGKANSANAGASATGQQKPSPLPNTKIAAREAGKRDVKGKTDSADARTSATSKSILLPVLRPKNATTEAKKQESKAKVETVGAGSGATAAGLHKPSAKSKTAEIENRKQNGKGKMDLVTAGGTAAGAKQNSSSAPVLRPKNVTTEAKKQESKVKVETVGASSGATAAGLHKPSVKSKTTEIENRKQNGKGKMDSVPAGGTAAGGKQNSSSAPTSKIAGSEAKKSKREGKADSGNVGASAVGGKQKPALVAKSKAPAIEVKRQETKGKGTSAGEDGRAAAKSSRQATGRRAVSSSTPQVLANEPAHVR